MATLTMDPVRVGDVSFYDRYGFAVYNPESEFAEEDCRTHEYNEQSDGECSKTRKFWAKMLENWEENQLFSPKQLRHSIKLGIPDDMRGEVWNKMIGSQAIKVISSFDYQACLTEIRQLLVDLGVSEYGGINCISRLGQIVGSLIDNDKVSMIDSPDTAVMTRQWKKKLQKQISVFRQIMLDIDRSFPSHKMFIEGTNEGKEGRAALFRVLAVYAMYNPQVSYCQGMSYIAGMFLMNMEEEASFWCLVSMFERPKYLAGYFNDSLGKIQRHAAVFERLMTQRRTKLYKHLLHLNTRGLEEFKTVMQAPFKGSPRCVTADVLDTVVYGSVYISTLLGRCTRHLGHDSVGSLVTMSRNLVQIINQGCMSVIFQVALALLDVLSVEILPLTEIAQVLPLLLRPPASLITREKLVTAIWKVKPILKWEIDSIQAVIDEEKENLQAKRSKRSKRSLNDHDAGNKKKKQRTLSNQPSQAVSEPSFFQRFIGLFSSKEESAIQFKTNDIEMKTFSVVSGQSPDVLMPALCCSAAGRTPNARDSPRRPLARSRRQPNKASQKRSNSGKDLLRKRHVVCQETMGSPVRRSPRLAGRRTPVGTKGKSPSSLVRSSARNQHAFKLFNTPRPLRRSQVKPLRQHFSPSHASSPRSVVSPDLCASPDVEMTSFNLTKKRLDILEK